MNDDWLRTRPDPSVWSPLEYTVHTRDAVAWYAERIRTVLSQDRPQLTGRDWDRLCAEQRYNEQNPDASLQGLIDECVSLATVLSELSDPEWRRLGIGRDGDTRTVDELARRAAHEVQHHAFDIRRMIRGDPR